MLQNPKEAHQYNTVISPDFLEEDIYPEGYPGLVIVHYDNDELVSAHWHQGLEVIHTIHGGGSFQVEDQHYMLRDNDNLLISPYKMHQGRTVSHSKGLVKIISVTFNNEVVGRIYPFADRFLFSLSSPHANMQDRKNLDQLMISIGSLYEYQNTASAFLLNATLYQLLHSLYTRFTIGVRPPESIRSGRNVTRQILGYLANHHTENLTERTAAAYFGYSREHFSRLFRKTTGSTFKSYLTKLRLDDARANMDRSSGPITNIAADAGFPNLTSFTRSFTREYGITPRQYRRGHLQIDQATLQTNSDDLCDK
ncbi:AraC family transcriptional regulator [Bifidobacterium sp. B4142]|uniref:AraC family transcriptional regulator n=1 Tax=Bifidobacterium sp. B4142 TaxID=2817962 RepID=UPI00226B9638|nr:AraC family transcriptional regulator [Bifidobacterium sp. B4142]MCX8688207.1 helix-turn-helix transcriptional regulator [Bifidobacterium sp. B4142]